VFGPLNFVLAVTMFGLAPLASPSPKPLVDSGWDGATYDAAPWVATSERMVGHIVSVDSVDAGYSTKVRALRFLPDGDRATIHVILSYPMYDDGVVRSCPGPIRTDGACAASLLQRPPVDKKVEYAVTIWRVRRPAQADELFMTNWIERSRK
jgi:hypothetical protein